jgi:tetratricopeptide (TPR) repeat protein
VKKTHFGVGTAIAVFCCWAALSASPAYAQSAAAAAAAASNPEYQALFKRMYANPQDMDATFKFADVAERLGDYEAAIGALERVLLYNPNLAPVKVRLAQLYYRIGGTETAKSYLEQAMATPGVSSEVQGIAQQLLISGGTTGVGGGEGFHLYSYSGARYQTNASAGPASQLITSFNNVQRLDRRFRAAPDWNYFTLNNASYTQDLGGGLSAEANLFGYYAKQVNLWWFDLGVAELIAGPRLAIPAPFVNDASIKVYGIGTATWLNEDPYYNGAGFGVAPRFSLGDVRFEPSYEWRDRNFKNSDFYPATSQQSGLLQVAALTADGKLFGALPFAGRGSFSWNRTDVRAFDFNSYDRWAVDIGFPFTFALNVLGEERQFVFTPTAGYTLTDYEAPNPAIQRGVFREDREWRIGAALDVQVYQNWGIRTFVQYSEVSSNIPNFEYTNFSVSVGPTYRF